jgi:hypothetical protein
MYRHFAAIGLAVLFTWPGNCPAQSGDPGPVRVGDRWSYKIMDGATEELRNTTTVVVVGVSNKEITTSTSFNNRERPLRNVYDLEWGRIDEGNFKVRPSGIGIKQPLHVGKEWRSDANVTNLQNGAISRASGFAKVAGKEQVVTPAGTFDTLRVEMRVRTVNTKDQTFSATTTFVVWYAPEINRWAKRKMETLFEGRVRESVVEELTEYSRKP